MCVTSDVIVNLHFYLIAVQFLGPPPTCIKSAQSSWQHTFWFQYNPVIFLKGLEKEYVLFRVSVMYKHMAVVQLFSEVKMAHWGITAAVAGLVLAIGADSEKDFVSQNPAVECISNKAHDKEMAAGVRRYRQSW